MTMLARLPRAHRRPTHEPRTARVWWTRISLFLAIVFLVAGPLVPGVITIGSALALVRVPVESIVILLALILAPWRPMRVVLALLFGAFVVVAIVLSGLDLGYEAVLDTHFDPANWRQLGDAFGVFADAIGQRTAVALVVLLAILVVALATGLAWAALRVDAAIRRHLRIGTAIVTAATAVWVLLALLGSQLVAGRPVAAAASVGAVDTAASQATITLAAQAKLSREIAGDPFATTPSSDLLTALRGKDVVIAFIESYGQVALQGTDFSKGVASVLQDGDSALAAAGYTTASAWLTSPTFGGVSWLAHSTLQSGFWVDSQQIYDAVVNSNRFTLSDAFGKAGWLTVSDVPSNTKPWPVGTSFYHYGTKLDSTNVGYQGPKFGYARIPDQYTWKYVADHFLDGEHQPVMAEIDFVSSHTPWAPLPQLVPWPAIGDGSIYDAQLGKSKSASQVWKDPQTVQQFYGQSVQYTLGAMFSFLQHVNDPNLVVIALGDHQPATIVSGKNANHEVPISIISKDPSMFQAINGWHWQTGLLPTSAAPLWRMDAFRDRFLTAFGPGG